MDNFQVTHYLAVDGGGTKTVAICADSNGQIVSHGSSGPTSLSDTSMGAASFNLREVVRQATEPLGNTVGSIALAMGLAGMDTPPEYELAKKIFADVLTTFPIVTFILVNDSVAALESGTDKPNALVIVSGTGSNCYGRNDKGETAKTGGMDYLLTDQGSGYIIGRQVLRDAVKSYDGRREKSILEDLVCQHFHIKSIAELKGQVYNPALTKKEVAELAKVGAQALEQGDEVARVIFSDAISSLVSMAATVMKRLKMSDKDADCVVTGGLFQVPFVKQNFVQQMQQQFPNLSLVFPTQEPVYGALKIAIRQEQPPIISHLSVNGNENGNSKI